MTCRCKRRGTTLVELVVYMALLTMLAQIVYGLLLGGLRLGRTTSLEVRQRFLLLSDQMVRDLALAEDVSIFLEAQQLDTIPLSGVSRDGQPIWALQASTYRLKDRALTRTLVHDSRLAGSPWHAGTSDPPFVTAATVKELERLDQRETHRLSHVATWEITAEQVSAARRLFRTRVTIELEKRPLVLERTLR